MRADNLRLPFFLKNTEGFQGRLGDLNRSHRLMTR
jgi:hypothetical protein